MMNLPPVIWTISVAFVPVRFSPAVSVGGVAGAFGISFEALRSQPGSRATAQNKTEPARKTGERACLARCVRRPYVFNGRFTSVAAAILAAVEGGILPPGPELRNGSDFSNHTPIPPGRMPGSAAGKMPAATVTTYRLLAEHPVRPHAFASS